MKKVPGILEEIRSEASGESLAGRTCKAQPQVAEKLGLDSFGFTSFITGKSLRLSWHQRQERCSPDNEKFLFTE